MSTYTRQYQLLTPEQRKKRGRQVAFVAIAFVALLVFVVLGSLWLLAGNVVHRLLPFGILIFFMAVLCAVAMKIAEGVTVKNDREETLLNIAATVFGVAWIPLGILAVVLVVVGLAGGS